MQRDVSRSKCEIKLLKACQTANGKCYATIVGCTERQAKNGESTTPKK